MFYMDYHQDIEFIVLILYTLVCDKDIYLTL